MTTFVTVCVCTYRRPAGLRALLRGLSSQTFAGTAPEVRVVVIDNEGGAESRAIIEAAAPILAVRYHHEAKRGISYARNRALASVEEPCDFVAMIDDDEIPEPDWLDRLLTTQAETNADVVQGAVIAVLAPEAPAWIRDGGFFGWPSRGGDAETPAWGHHEPLGSAATNNVLVRWSAIKALRLRFDERLALAGGEDAIFFRRLQQAGYRIVFAEDARVRETVPRERACLGYLFRQEFRNGNKRLAAKLWVRHADADGATRLRVALKTAARGARITASGVGTVAHALLRRVGAKEADRDIALAVGVLRIANGLGTIADCLGFRYQHYR